MAPRPARRAYFPRTFQTLAVARKPTKSHGSRKGHTLSPQGPSHIFCKIFASSAKERRREETCTPGRFGFGGHVDAMTSSTVERVLFTTGSVGWRNDPLHTFEPVCERPTFRGAPSRNAPHHLHFAVRVMMPSPHGLISLKCRAAPNHSHLHDSDGSGRKARSQHF